MNHSADKRQRNRSGGKRQKNSPVEMTFAVKLREGDWRHENVQKQSRRARQFGRNREQSHHRQVAWRAAVPDRRIKHGDRKNCQNNQNFKSHLFFRLKSLVTEKNRQPAKNRAHQNKKREMIHPLPVEISPENITDL